MWKEVVERQRFMERYTNYSSQRSGSRTSCNGEILANELMENYYLQTPI